MCDSQQTGQELSPGPAMEQDGMGWSVSTWLNVPWPKTRMSASKLTIGNGPGPLPSPEPWQGVAWELSAALGQNVS